MQMTMAALFQWQRNYPGTEGSSGIVRRGEGVNNFHQNQQQTPVGRGSCQIITQINPSSRKY